MRDFSNSRLFVIVAFCSFFFILLHPVYAVECIEREDSSFELVLDCIDTVDVKKETMELMYADVNRFSNSFDGAKVKDITTIGNITFATLEVPLPVISNLEYEIKFTRSQNYLLEFLDGNLKGSSISISLSKMHGYDGTIDGATKVSFLLKIKEVPCFVFGLKCGSTEDFEYILDKGLYLLELESNQFSEDFHQNYQQNDSHSESSLTKAKYPHTETQIESNQITNTNFTKNDFDDNFYLYTFDSCGLKNGMNENSNLVKCNDISSLIDDEVSDQFPNYWMNVSTKWYQFGLISEKEYQNGVDYFLNK